MIEINLILLDDNNQPIGKYSQRFLSQKELQIKLFDLEAKGLRFKHDGDHYPLSTISGEHKVLQ